MLHRTRTLILLAALASCTAGMARAQVCQATSSCTATFSSGQTGLTIAPNGGIETFAGNGITIDVYLKDCNGTALVGVPAAEISLYLNTEQYCICPGGNLADAATDSFGHTRFTGTIRGGGCAQSLSVYADGVFIGTLPVKINSPDHVPASPCHVDAADLSSLAGVLGNSLLYSFCYDYNETGPPTINAGDLSYFAALLGVECP